MATIETLKAKDIFGDEYTVYPRGITSAIRDTNGAVLDATLRTIEGSIIELMNELVDIAINDTY
jgi:hypothetical protein